MLKKKVSNKFFCMFLLVAITLLGSICMASMNWSHLITCMNSLDKATVWGKKALEVYASTTVNVPGRAGVIATLEYIDEFGDWVSSDYGWMDYDQDCAAIGDTVKVGSGSYRLRVAYMAYADDDVNHEHPLEFHSNYSVVQTY